MKLNQNQRYALFGWLCKNIKSFLYDHVLRDYDQFCDGEIIEWRVISDFGMAGKIWNNWGQIYISGYSRCEIGEKAYNKQQEKIDQWNNEIFELLAMYG